MNTKNNIHTVLGAGPVAKATVAALLARGLPVRVVHRSGTFPQQPGLEVVAADISDAAQLTQAFMGSTVVYMCAMPAYHRWAQEFDTMMHNVLQACATTGSAMVFADNLYMYQESPNTPLTEATPLRPGLVVTLLNVHRPRDRSHYERFQAYHESFYRAVEVTSVTPFAPGIAATSGAASPATSSFSPATTSTGAVILANSSTVILSREARMQAASAFRSLFVCSAKRRNARAAGSLTSSLPGASRPRATASAPPTPVIIRDARPANTARLIRAGCPIVRNAATLAPIEYPITSARAISRWSSRRRASSAISGAG